MARSFGGGFPGWETSADIQLDTVWICFDPVFLKVEITTDPLTCEMLFFRRLPAGKSSK